MTDNDELRMVIDKKWDYLVIRQALSKLSGMPCMAITTMSHIHEIEKRLRENQYTIDDLTKKLKAAQEILK